MVRIYTAPFVASSQTAQIDFFELLAATGKPCAIHAVSLFQTSEIGDAMEEILGVKLKRGVGVTSGSGGSTVTPAPRSVADAAAGATVEVNNTTKATGGTITDLDILTFNVRVGLDKIWTPELRPLVYSGDRAIFELVNTPADSITFNGCLTFEELF